MAINFQVAAEASQADEDEDVVEVPIGDKIYQARRPTAAQYAILLTKFNDSSGSTIERLNAVYEFVEAMMGLDARKHVERLAISRHIDLGDLLGGSDLNPDGGLIDQILEEFSGFPTVPSTASVDSRPAGGKRSTGRSPGKGSTHSPSPSTAS